MKVIITINKVVPLIMACTYSTTSVDCETYLSLPVEGKKADKYCSTYCWNKGAHLSNVSCTRYSIFYYFNCIILICFYPLLPIINLIFLNFNRLIVGINLNVTVMTNLNQPNCCGCHVKDTSLLLVLKLYARYKKRKRKKNGLEI